MASDNKSANKSTGKSITSATVTRKSGLLKGLSSSKPNISLSVSVSDVDIYIHPLSSPSVMAEPGDPEDERSTLVIVNVSLVVPQEVKPPEQITSLIVSFKTDETLGFPSGIYERNNPHEIVHEVESAKGMQLESGKKYQWDVPIRISAKTAPYSRGIYGRLFQKIVVTVEWPGWSSWFKSNGGLTVEKLVFVATVPETTDVLSYVHDHNGFVDTLGPVICHARSRQLSVGGYLRFALLLSSLPPGVQLQKLVLTLTQNTTLVSRKEAGLVEHCNPERTVFLQVNAEELQGKVVQGSGGSGDGDSLDASWIARLPNDQEIRASTLHGNDAAIRHEHMLEMTLSYSHESSAGSKGTNVYSASWPLVLPACGLLLPHIKLPSYSENDPSPVPDWSRDDWDPTRYANIHVSQATCCCGQSLEKLLAWEDIGDDEERNCTTSLMRQALETSSIRSRSRSRQRRGGGQRTASATPSLHSRRNSFTLAEEPSIGNDEEEDEEVREERMIQQKAAQRYRA